MLIAALTAYLLIHYGSHSSALTMEWNQTITLIKQNVADETRQNEALAIVNKMKMVSASSAKEREKSVDALNKLLAKRELPASEIQRAARPLISDDKVTANKLLDLRFQLKTILTAREWALVFPAPAKGSGGTNKGSHAQA